MHPAVLRGNAATTSEAEYIPHIYRSFIFFVFCCELPVYGLYLFSVCYFPYGFKRIIYTQTRVNFYVINLQSLSLFLWWPFIFRSFKFYVNGIISDALWNCLQHAFLMIEGGHLHYTQSLWTLIHGGFMYRYYKSIAYRKTRNEGSHSYNWL